VLNELEPASESFRELTGEPLLGDFCAETRQTEHCLAFHACQTFLLKCVCAFVWRVSEIIRTWSNKKDQGFTRIDVQTNSQSNSGNERESWVQPTTASTGRRDARNVWEQLEAYSSEVHRFVGWRVANRADAEDIAQQALLVACAKFNTLRGENFRGGC